jgi:ribonuclease T2
MRLLTNAALPIVAVAVGMLITSPGFAQQKGVPGKFDFYLLDMPWGPEFCSIKDVSPQCEPQRTFVLHGLWAQNYDGTWPVFCSDKAGPKDIAKHLALTPDLQLLHHEWDKHGTCSAVGPQRFFAMEHEAFRKVKIPVELKSSERELSFSTDKLMNLFELANPGFPAGSFSLSCKDGKLISVEACFDKNLHAIQCRGLHSCSESIIKLQAFADAVQK